MIKIIFVGDKPSSKNTHPDVAFIGTPSHRNLVRWIGVLDCFNYLLINSETHNNMKDIKQVSPTCKVVALGNNASVRLTEAGVKHFKLPHPSPKNRVLNDKPKLNSLLQLCKEYLHET